MTLNILFGHYSSSSDRFFKYWRSLSVSDFIYSSIKNLFWWAGALSSSAVFVLGTVVFVMACYPTGKVRIWGRKCLCVGWFICVLFFCPCPPVSMSNYVLIVSTYTNINLCAICDDVYQYYCRYPGKCLSCVCVRPPIVASRALLLAYSLYFLHRSYHSPMIDCTYCFSAQHSSSLLSVQSSSVWVISFTFHCFHFISHLQILFTFLLES